MRNAVVSLFAVAGLAAAASGQVGSQGLTNVNVEVSTDNVAWSNAVALNQGSGAHTVYVRFSVSWVGTGNAPGGGLASFQFQPTFQNFNVGGADSIFAYKTSGSNPGVPDASGANVAPDATNMGRLGNYAGIAISTSVALTNYINTPGAGANFLRIALATVTNWIGTGTSTTANNNVSGLGGIPTGQVPPGALPPPTNDPNTTNAHIFKVAISVDTTNLRTITVDTPGAGVQYLSSTLRPRRGGIWYSATTVSSGDVFADLGVVTDGLISIIPVPTPGSLALIGLGGLMVGRRRR